MKGKEKLHGWGCLVQFVGVALLAGAIGWAFSHATFVAGIVAGVLVFIAAAYATFWRLDREGFFDLPEERGAPYDD